MNHNITDLGIPAESELRGIGISAENDYMVNLKAELEICQFHEKLDHHMGTQDHKLNELQRVQISFMHDQLDRLRQG